MLAQHLAFAQHFVEQHSRPPDERFTCLVLVLARTFSDDHQRGVWVPDPENNVGSSVTQVTTGTVRRIRAERLDTRRLIDWFIHGTFVIPCMHGS